MAVAQSTQVHKEQQTKPREAPGTPGVWASYGPTSGHRIANMAPKKTVLASNINSMGRSMGTVQLTVSS
jgi:hypothetical protein